MRTQIIYIIKDDFFFAFKRAFHATIGPENVRVGFKATKLIPYDAEKMINNLNFKSYTFTPLNSRPPSSASINSNTPRTAKDALRDFINLKSRIAKHQSSFLTHLYELINI